MCAIKIPVSPAGPSSKQGPPEQADYTERIATIDACESRTMKKKDNSISCTSFQAVTIIDPEVEAFSPTASTIEEVSEQMEDLKVKEGNVTSDVEERNGPGDVSWDSGVGDGGTVGGTDEWVSALFVFGGMDTFGNVHGDTFILVP